jgi:pyruvate dehydrogenase E2 component (dihydrolipoamide acetyltransferase)
MPFTINMPKLSPTMEEGTIVKWNKKEGELVKEGDTLIEVATDKATVEYNVLDEGYLRKILVPEGQSAKLNQPIAIFTKTKDESIEGYSAEPEKKEEEVTKEKEPPKEEKPEEKKEAPKETQIAKPSFKIAAPLKEYEFDIPIDKSDSRILASPLAKSIAKEKELDLSSVKGTGPNGRIMSRDLDLAKSDTLVEFGDRKAPEVESGSYEEEKLSQMRKAISKTLQQSKMFIPHFYVKQEIDVDLLADIKDELKQAGIKVTYNDFVIRAVALALKQNPNMNVAYNFENDSIVRFKTIDVCIAVDVEGGLITPIIRYADYKNIGELSLESRHLAKKARDGKLQMHEYQGGSFTITNLGMFGIDEFSSIINPPQAGILAVGAVKQKPSIKDNKIENRKKMSITLSCDHRIIDGATAAKFVISIQELLENPAVLLVK